MKNLTLIQLEIYRISETNSGRVTVDFAWPCCADAPESVNCGLPKAPVARLFPEYFNTPDMSLAVYKKFKDNCSFNVGAPGNGRVNNVAGYLISR